MMVDPKVISLLDEELGQKRLEGLWYGVTEADIVGRDPRTAVIPHLWKWQDLYECLQKAGNVHGLEGQAERRVLCLVNPGLKNLRLKRSRGTTHTMQMTVQLLKPGELARSHRHNFGAFRFIIQGKGAYTVINGEKIVMEEGDLVLTPPMTWHGHGNDAEPMIWIDGLDNILLNALQVISWEPFPGDHQPVDSIDTTSHRAGPLRPLWEKPQGALAYRWKDTAHTLQSLRDAAGSPFDGVVLEYTNPITGGHTFPTMSCGIQLLRPGEITKTHRHNSSTAYHAFQGRGATVIDSKRYEWEKGDCFVVPLWSWHSHENRSIDADAILFSMNDRPTLEALKLYTEEAKE